MSRNRYWNVPGGVAIGCLHPNDMQELFEKLEAEGFCDPNKPPMFFFPEEPLWKGVGCWLTLTEEEDRLARLVVSEPVFYVSKLLGRPLRDDGVPVIQPDGQATVLTPMM